MIIASEPASEYLRTQKPLRSISEFITSVVFNKYRWWSLKNGEFILVEKDYIQPTPILDIAIRKVNLDNGLVLNDQWDMQLSFDDLDL